MEGALTKLSAALEARSAAYAALAVARSNEDAAKLDHELALEKLMGEVRKLFPKDRQRQDLLFPAVQGSSARNDDDDVMPEPAQPK